MEIESRKHQIMELLKTNGSVKVTELSRMFDVSEVTIRNDLATMESRGLLSRIHGGAISTYKPYYNMNLSQRLKTNSAEKMRIARKISEMIEPNDTIMLNSGTTTLLAFRELPSDYSLNIVTNSIAIALESSANPNYNVILIGGNINPKYQFTYGGDAVAQLRRYHADKLILSVDGVDTQNGFTTYYDKEVELDRVMLEQSNMRIIAADNTKFQHSAFAKIAEISVADRIVTNACADETLKEAFEGLNVEICFA